MTTKSYFSLDDKSMISSLHLLVDNKNKLKLVDKMQLYCDFVEKSPGPTIKKSEVVVLMSQIVKFMKKSHELIDKNLPHGAKSYYDAMNRLQKKVIHQFL